MGELVCLHRHGDVGPRALVLLQARAIGRRARRTGAHLVCGRVCRGRGLGLGIGLGLRLGLGLGLGFILGHTSTTMGRASSGSRQQSWYVRQTKPSTS